MRAVLARVGRAFVNIDVTVLATQHIAFDGIFVYEVVQAVAVAEPWFADTAVLISRNLWADVVGGLDTQSTVHAGRRCALIPVLADLFCSASDAIDDARAVPFYVAFEAGTRVRTWTSVLASCKL